jgi:hypothetical protein
MEHKKRKPNKNNTLCNWKTFLFNFYYSAPWRHNTRKNGHLCGAAKDVLRLFQDLKRCFNRPLRCFKMKRTKKMRVQTHLFSMETRVNSRKTTYYIYIHVICPLCI